MSMFPPKNRVATALPLLRIQIVDRAGVHEFDPNGIVLLYVQQGVVPWEPIQEANSVLTGHPGTVFYESGDLRISLALDEVCRLVLTALRPAEYFKLRELYGMAFEWHEDFYDPRSGVALQPKV